MGVAHTATLREDRDADERRRLLGREADERRKLADQAQARETQLFEQAQAREKFLADEARQRHQQAEAREAKLFEQAQAHEKLAQAREKLLIEEARLRSEQAQAREAQAQAREKQLLDEARQRERAAFDLAAAQEQYNLDLMRKMMHERDILANEKEKISFDREQRQLEMRMLDQQKQTELALKRAEKESEIALERENKIRQDMRELAALETRNVLLEQQLREIKSKQEIVGIATVAQPPPPISAEFTENTIVAPSSPEIDDTGHFVHNRPTLMTDSRMHTSLDAGDVATTSAAATTVASHQMSQGRDISLTVAPPTVRHTEPTPTFVAPCLPPVSSMNLIPLSSVINATPELLQTLPVINTPSGPAVQAIPLINSDRQTGIAQSSQQAQQASVAQPAQMAQATLITQQASLAQPAIVTQPASQVQVTSMTQPASSAKPGTLTQQALQAQPTLLTQSATVSQPPSQAQSASMTQPAFLAQSGLLAQPTSLTQPVQLAQSTLQTEMTSQAQQASFAKPDNLVSQVLPTQPAPLTETKSDVQTLTQPVVTSDANMQTNTTASSTVVSVSSAPNASPASSSSIPIVVINTPQAVRPYNGTTSWSSFKDHFERVAKVNKWDTDEIKAQHLQLALEAAAAETLKDLNEGSPTFYQDIWGALKKRFGEVDETRSAMSKFERRRQHEGESVVEYEQALRLLYRVAWPHANDQQKTVALKARFEEGLNNPDMQQYLRLHASMDDFSATVQKARRFASTIEMPKPRKTVRISTPPPSHDSVQRIESHSSLFEKMDKLEDLVRSMQSVSQKNQNSTSSGGGSNVKCLNNSKPSPKPPPVSQQKKKQQQGSRDNSPAPRPTGQMTNRQQYGQPFNNNNRNGQFPPRQWTANRQWSSNRPMQYNSGRMTPQGDAPPPNSPGAGNQMFRRSPPTCWTCGKVGCYSFYHDDGRQTPPPQRSNRPQTPPPQWNNNQAQTPPPNPNWNGNWQQPNSGPFRRGRGCWICGAFGCHSMNHSEEERSQIQSVPTLMSPPGNVSGTRQTGDRGPNQPARPHSN